MELVEVRGLFDEHRGCAGSVGRGEDAMGDATLGCPVQEGPYLAVSPSAVGQPVVNVALVHGGEGGPTGLEPEPGIPARHRPGTECELHRLCPVAVWPGGPGAGIPDGVTTDQSRMVGRIVRQVPIQPRLDALGTRCAAAILLCERGFRAHS